MDPAKPDPTRKPAAVQPAGVRSFRLDQDTASVKQAVGAWGAALPVFDVATAGGGAFTGEFTAHATERLLLSRASMSPVRLSRSRATIARAPLMHFVIKLLVAGAFTGEAEQSSFAMEPGDVLFIDLLRTMELRSHADTTTEVISLWFPRARLQPLLNNYEAVHGLMLKGDRAAGALVGSSLAAFAAHAAEMTLADMDIFGGAVIALIARAIVPELRAADKASAAVPMTLNAVRRFIDQNLLSKDLEVDLIAANFGLSRASLYRLFAPIGGVAGYIRKQRLERAFQQIVSAEFANQRIAGIARRCGFDNLSGFTRLFQKTYGITPAKARQAAAEGRATKADETEHAANPMADWLASLHP